MTPNLKYATVCYLVMMVVLLNWKPRFTYDHEKGRYKAFGMKTHETLFPVWLLCALLAILSYVAMLSFLSITAAPSGPDTRLPLKRNSSISNTTPIMLNVAETHPLSSTITPSARVMQFETPDITHVQAAGPAAHEKTMPRHGMKIPDSKLWKTAMK